MIPPPKLKGTPVLQFRAGKATYQRGIVTPLAAKGYLSFLVKGPDYIEMIWTSPDEQQLVNLPKGRTSASVVEKCTTGRMILLEVTGAHVDRYFFWFQDKLDSKDAGHISKLKSILSPQSSTGTSRAVELDDFKKLLAGISASNTPSIPQDVSLVDIISFSKLTDALKEDPTFYMSKLKEFLPEGVDASASIVEQVKNPQVTATAAALTSALNDPMTYEKLVVSFGIPQTAGRSGVEAFLSSISKAAKKT